MVMRVILYDISKKVNFVEGILVIVMNYIYKIEFIEGIIIFKNIKVMKIFDVDVFIEI